VATRMTVRLPSPLLMLRVNSVAACHTTIQAPETAATWGEQAFHTHVFDPTGTETDAVLLQTLPAQHVSSHTPRNLLTRLVYTILNSAFLPAEPQGRSSIPPQCVSGHPTVNL